MTDGWKWESVHETGSEKLERNNETPPLPDRGDERLRGCLCMYVRDTKTESGSKSVKAEERELLTWPSDT